VGVGKNDLGSERAKEGRGNKNEKGEGKE